MGPLPQVPGCYIGNIEGVSRDNGKECENCRGYRGHRGVQGVALHV